MQFPSTPRRWKSARDDDDDVSTFCISSTRALPSFPSSSPLFIVSEMAPSPYLFHTVYCTLFTIRQTHTRTRIPTNHNHHQSFVRTITSSFHFISFHFFFLPLHQHTHTHTHVFPRSPCRKFREVNRLQHNSFFQHKCLIAFSFVFVSILLFILHPPPHSL